jgi:PII-like signaling protein
MTPTMWCTRAMMMSRIQESPIAEAIRYRAPTGIGLGEKQETDRYFQASQYMLSLSPQA